MHWKGVILSVVVGIVLYWSLLAGADLDSSLAAVAGLTWTSWLFVLALSLLNYGIRFVRWDWYCRSLGHHLPAIRHLIIYLAGFALTTTPANAGEAIRAIYLKPYGIGYGRCIAVLYSERLVDIITMAMLAVLLFFLPVPGYGWISGIAFALAGTLLLIQHPALLDVAAGLADRLSWRRLRAAAQYVIASYRETTQLLRFRALAIGLGLGILSWGAEALAFHHVLQALDIPVSLAGATGIYATAMLAGALSFVPGGLGGTEVVMLSLLILSGAPPPAAVAATAIIRVATLWFAVVVGVVALTWTESLNRPRQTPVMPACGSGNPRAGR
jgi:uncharacterized protein (TIRG00374 family)